MLSRYALCCLVIVAVASGAAFALENHPPAVTNVVAAQREDSSLVDIYYNLADEDGDSCAIRLRISTDEGRTWAIIGRTVTGDIGPGIELGEGKHIVCINRESVSSTKREKSGCYEKVGNPRTGHLQD